MRFWMQLGVDGLRLDAVPYLVEREGTNNENLPETHQILKRLRAQLDRDFPDRMMLAETAWPPAERPHIFVCGPTPLVESVAEALVELGHDPTSVKTERFGPTGGSV